MFIFCNYITPYLLLCSTVNSWIAVDGKHSNEDDIHCPAIRGGLVYPRQIFPKFRRISAEAAAVGD